MDAIVTQVVLDRRGITDDFDQKIGISVNQLVSKLVDQDRLACAIEDAKQARLELENVTRQKNELELEVGQKDGKYRCFVLFNINLVKVEELSWRNSYRFLHI